MTPLILSFDLDDTLWPVGPVMIAAEKVLYGWLQTRHAALMHDQDIDKLRALRAAIALEHPDRSHDMTFMRHRTLMRLFEPASDAGALADEALEVFLTERNRVVCYDDVECSLLRLHEKYRLYALSNGNADLKRCGLAHWFDGHVTAISAGCAKPDGRIFAHLARQAGVEPHQVLHIGDDPHADVVGAMRAGMQVAWLNRDAREWPADLAPPPRTISTLAEII